MQSAHAHQFERTDIWREGKWIDLWSVVHLFSGLSIGLGFYFLRFDAWASVVLALVSLIAYEMWEMIVKIEETPTNRFMDVVVGMTGFLPAFFFFAPLCSSRISLALTFGCVLTINIVMSVFGWHASQKAAALKARMLARYLLERDRLSERNAELRKRFHRRSLNKKRTMNISD